MSDILLNCLYINTVVCMYDVCQAICFSTYGALVQSAPCLLLFLLSFGARRTLALFISFYCIITLCLHESASFFLFPYMIAVSNLIMLPFRLLQLLIYFHINSVHYFGKITALDSMFFLLHQILRQHSHLSYNVLIRT